MADEVEREGDGAEADSVPRGEDERRRGLHCLASGALPSEFEKEAGRIARLPDRVLADLGPIVKSCVLQPMTPEVGDQLSRFCVQHEVAEADLGGVLKVCGWLLRKASALDLTTEQLGQDVATIFGDKAEVAKVLQEEYGPFKRSVRQQLLNEALTNHGNVLVDVDWRVDRVVTERSAAKLDSAVALVTLAYQNADGTGRLTLQITPDRLARLAQVFGALAQKTVLAGEPRGGAEP
ncbi:MAG: hypothetical protein JRI68_32140 [Deltaproteobacteria bacterium]|nr:hypothetical protein [Deltaproteobacteria bacterium]